MPVLDEAAGIADALDALASLRDKGAEVIVIDGGSGDGTPALCEGRCDGVLHAPRGRARQMNAGAAAARGDALVFLHVDTRLPEGALSAIERALAHAAWGRFDVAISGRSRVFPLIAALMNRRSALTGIATGDQAMFVRRDVFGAVGGFPDQPLMEDIELSRRLRKCGRPARIALRVVTSGRRWERFGVWRTIVLMWRLRLLYWLGTPAHELAKLYR